MAIASGIGATIGGAALDSLLAANDGRLDRALFGEAGSRVIVTCDPAAIDDAQSRASALGLDLLELGTTGGERWRSAARSPRPSPSCAMHGQRPGAGARIAEE
ncbi:MAG: hypothetical protein U0232_01485 [Thermomicrobiales bacterium]